MDMLLFGLLTGDILSNAGAHVFIKLGMRRHPAVTERGLVGALAGILLNPWAMLGMACYGTSFLFYAALLAKMDLSLAYPICTSVAFLMVLAASLWLFAERMNSWRVGGVLAILFGIVLISIG